MFRKNFKRLEVDNLKKNGLNKYVYDVSVDYDIITADDILGIHDYLMKKNDMVQQNVWVY